MIQVRSASLQKEHRKSNGGFLAYWKLMPQLWATINFIPGRGQRTMVRLIFFLKAPWWMFIKPFGSLFSTRTYFKGEFEKINGILTKVNIKKKVVWFLIYLPFFFYYSNLTHEELESL